MASNFPLLGRKSSPWEGGTRVAALLAGGRIPASLRSTDSTLLIHISDFYATFARLAGVDPSDKYRAADGRVHDVDGIDVWGAVRTSRRLSPARHLNHHCPVVHPTPSVDAQTTPHKHTCTTHHNLTHHP